MVVSECDSRGTDKVGRDSDLIHGASDAEEKLLNGSFQNGLDSPK
jgi:hypothetical protein